MCTVCTEPWQGGLQNRLLLLVVKTGAVTTTCWCSMIPVLLDAAVEHSVACTLLMSS
jgi:hypothetical protein